MPQIYLDHNSTTRPHPAVRAAMHAALDETFANPSSVHAPGRAARDLVERARRQVASLLGASSDEIVFTSGGTEGDNLAVRGTARAVRDRTGRRTIVSSPIEHAAVLASLRVLGEEGFRTRFVPVDQGGRIDPAALRALVDEDTALVSLAAVNHEIGNVYPLADFVSIAHEVGALFHSDAVQAAGKIPLDLPGLGVDLATISSHKLYGPKGAGAVYQRRSLSLTPLVVGGSQEKERRPGTENVPGIAGFGCACELARANFPSWMARIERLRDRLEAGAFRLGARRFGEGPRADSTMNLGFPGVDGELLLMNLDLEGIAVSTGAACSSGSVEPSRVVQALGVPREEARQAVRFSLGIDNTDDEIDRVLGLLPEILDRIRRSELAHPLAENPLTSR